MLVAGGKTIIEVAAKGENVYVTTSFVISGIDWIRAEREEPGW